MVTDDPKIIFRDGPTGLRAALNRGPDVWELVAAFNQAKDYGDQAVQETAELLDLTASQVRAALRYYRRHPTEIDERIARNAR